MKAAKPIHFLQMILLFFNFPVSAQDSEPKVETEVDIEILGDINNDKVVDPAFVTKPKFIDEDRWGLCRNGGCEVTISFLLKLAGRLLGNAGDAGQGSLGDVIRHGFAQVIAVRGWT